jgi:hypothetical protein
MNWQKSVNLSTNLTHFVGLIFSQLAKSGHTAHRAVRSPQKLNCNSGHSLTQEAPPTHVTIPPTFVAHFQAFLSSGFVFLRLGWR